MCLRFHAQKSLPPPRISQAQLLDVPTLVPVVLHRDQIPPKENQLRDIAFILSKELADPSFRETLLNMMENTPFQDHALRWNDVAPLVQSDTQLSIDAEFGQWIKINFPVPQHFQEFQSNPRSKIWVTYAPMADDQQIKKIVAFNEGTPLFLDAWGEAPKTPTLVVSLEPILRKERSTTANSQDGPPTDTTAHLQSCGSTRYFPNDLYLRSFKFMVRTEPWFLQPAEIYFLLWKDNGSPYVVRLPSNGSNTWWSARRNHEKVISCPGKFMGSNQIGFIKIYMKEDDSHPPSEWGRDDFIGGECAEWWHTTASWNCPGYSSVIKTYFKRNGQRTSYIRLYERY